MQWMGCSEFVKKKFNEHPVSKVKDHEIFALLPILFWTPCLSRFVVALVAGVAHPLVLAPRVRVQVGQGGRFVLALGAGISWWGNKEILGSAIIMR